MLSKPGPLSYQPSEHELAQTAYGPAQIQNHLGQKEQEGVPGRLTSL